MLVKDILEKLGINISMINHSWNLDLEEEVKLGYEIRNSICADQFGKKFSLLVIMPNRKWTDGTVKPDYCQSWYSNIDIYLKCVWQSVQTELSGNVVSRSQACN